MKCFPNPLSCLCDLNWSRKINIAGGSISDAELLFLMLDRKKYQTLSMSNN